MYVEGRSSGTDPTKSWDDAELVCLRFLDPTVRRKVM